VLPIKKMSQYFQWDHVGNPGHNYPLHTFTEKDLQWCNAMVLSGQDDRTPRVHPSRGDENRMIYALWDIALPYYMADALSSNAFENVSAQHPWYRSSNAKIKNWYLTFCWEQNDNFVKEALQQFNNDHRGLYKSYRWGWWSDNSNSRNDRYYSNEVQVPYYQFPLVFGAQFPNNDSHKWKTPHKSVAGFGSSDRRHQDISRTMFCRLFGSGIGSMFNYGGKTIPRENFDGNAALRHVTEIEYDQYRVNAYDISSQSYDCYELGSSPSPIITTTLYNPFKDWSRATDVKHLVEPVQRPASSSGSGRGSSSGR